ncbi:histidine kinase dimerization/phospho-acceptor domain-containing protein, partial [Thermodesulfobacteriota bacterium]
EIRTLGEISARMAHEIRNPLSAAGGFARRLRESLDDDQNKKLADIIVEEVAKLEEFVKGLLATITPFDLSYSEIDLNKVILDPIINLKHLLKSRGLEVITVLDSGLPRFQADYERIQQAIENIVKHAAVSAPQEENITISSSTDGQKAVVEISHRVLHLSDDDIEQFFFPHIEPKIEESVLDLPLAKIIIHRHGGKIDLARDEENVLNMTIEVPVVKE